MKNSKNIYIVSNSRILDRSSIIGWSPDLLLAMTCRQQHEASLQIKCFVKECRKITFETDFPNMEDREIIEVNFHTIPMRYAGIYRKSDNAAKEYYTDLIQEIKKIRTCLESKKERKILKKTIDLLEDLHDRDISTTLHPRQCEEILDSVERPW